MTSASPPQPAADNAQQRRALRAQLLQARLQLPEAQRRAATAQIVAQVQAWLQQYAAPAHTVALYSAHQGEVDVSAWARHAAHALALPVVVGKHAPLQFAAWQPGDALVLDAYGIAVPRTLRMVQPDVLLIPCLGFTRTRLRLGYGGGYYDRTLAMLNPRPLAAGIAFAQQECVFAAQPHDVHLDVMLTEHGAV
jgi:5-formyltetrahydrofolate cyclo-ligase